MNQEYTKKGFTMIETVIAFGVLVAAILGPVTLVAFSLAQAQSSQNKLIATNLGQEGLELVRAIRENNVICTAFDPTVTWNTDPTGDLPLGESNKRFTVDANDRVTAPTEPYAVRCGFSTPRPIVDTTCDTRPLNLNANGVYTYGAGTPTPFQRCITICVPPSSGPCNGTDDPVVATTTDQMEVISKVFWTDRGLQRSVEFGERLYNWK